MSSISNIIKVHPADNVLVALSNLEKGTVVTFERRSTRSLKI